MYELVATAWYYETAAGGPIPCRWEGWVQVSAAVGWQWYVVSLIPL